MPEPLYKPNFFNTLLVAKQRTSSLSNNEEEELHQLIQEVEQLELHRVECLVNLAQLRGVSLTALMQSLGIQPQPYG